MKNSFNRRLSVFLSVAGLFAAGCDPNSGGGPSQRPIDSPEATKTVNQRVDTLLGGLADSTATLDTTGGTKTATGSLDQVFGGSSCSVTSGGATSTSSNGIDNAPKETAKALDDLLHQLVKEAKDHVFREEFVESKDGNQVVYKVDPVSACGSDSTCRSDLTKNPVRFAVTANSDDTLNVALLVGEARHTPATAVLGDKTLSVRVNLAELMDTVRLFVSTSEQKDLPDRLTGVIEGSIEKRGEGHFVISGSVIEKFDLLIGQAKGKPVAVTVDPSDPTVELTVNSLTNTLGYMLNLGAVDARVAGAAVCGRSCVSAGSVSRDGSSTYTTTCEESCGAKEKSGTFSGHLGGLTGSVAITKDMQELTVAGMGLGNGTSYVAINNDRLGSLDLNANNGRRVSVTFKRTDQGTLVTFDPALDIKLALTLNKLSESMRTDMPDWLSDEIFDVILGGAPKPSVLVPTGGCSIGTTPSKSKDQVKVVSGELTLRATSLASPVNVRAGMCLVPVDGVDHDAHVFSHVKADVCQ